jgi:hypothetical protein
LKSREKNYFRNKNILAVLLPFLSVLSFNYGCLEFFLFFGCDENKSNVILTSVSNQTPQRPSNAPLAFERWVVRSEILLGVRLAGILYAPNIFGLVGG